MSENVHQSAMKFHLMKGNFFRVIHADGAIGGITPSREIFLSLFSERGAIPTLIEQAVNADGSLGKEISRESKEGIVREIEVGVVLSSRAAKGIAEWLTRQAQILDASEPETALDQSASTVELP